MYIVIVNVLSKSSVRVDKKQCAIIIIIVITVTIIIK